MRRKDREIKSKAEIIEIIGKCQVCRIGLSEDNLPYIVPMNYGYEYIEDKLTLYFHCAKEGRKLDIIAKNPLACFEIDCSHKFIKIGDEDWDYSMEYESVMGNGVISLCNEPEEKLHGVKVLMKQYIKDKDFDFPNHIMESVAILKLEVAEFSGKRHLR